MYVAFKSLGVGNKRAFRVSETLLFLNVMHVSYSLK